MMNAKWKRILSLVMSLLMMLPGSAFAQTGPVYSAEDQTALNGYIELLGDGFGLNELNADYAPFVEAFVRDEIELRNEDGGPLWQETENGWSTENTFDYAFTGEVGEDLAQLMDQLMLRLVSGEEGGALSVGIGEGEEYTLPMSNVTGHADVFAYAIGTAEAPKLMVGAIGADDHSNAVVIGLNAETGAWEIETQVTTIGDMVILNEDVANVQVDTDGSIWLTGETGAKIYVIEDGKSRVIEYNEYGDLVTDAGAPGEDGAEGQEDLAAALLLAARCSILWGEGGADSVSLKTMLDTAKCTFCGGEGQHLSTNCTEHCLLEGGDHGPCEYCGERKCNHKAHGEDEGECGYIGAGPSKAPVAGPTAAPGVKPTAAPTTGTETQPTVAPTTGTETQPTAAPTTGTETQPTAAPTTGTETQPTAAPTTGTETQPTAAPTTGTETQPTAAPTAAPEVNPTAAPTAVPTEEPGIGGDAPDLPFTIECEKCGVEADSEDAHKAECGHWICAADWNDAEHVKCEGCGEYDCAADYNPDEHYQCEVCGEYICAADFDPDEHYQCEGCGEYICAADFDPDEHIECEGCGMHICADDYAAEDHETCPSCGEYECEEGYDSYEHEICLCGEYRCAGPEHMPCPGCTVPPCSEYYGEPEDHAQCEICGAFACDYGYDPEDHTECDLCGLIKCDPDHEYIYHHAYGEDRCLCMLGHDHTTSSPVIGEDGDVEEHYPLPCCGKCAYRHDAEYHVPAACGKEGHRNCDRDLHEQCEGCGEWTCDEDFVWEEHDYCANCQVYICDEDYAYIEHGDYESGKCLCTLRHNGSTDDPLWIGEEGREAHFALDCCGDCNFWKHSSHGKPADCGKEGHIACTYGPHNVCRGCGAIACDEDYNNADHSLCLKCYKPICNGANHNSQAPCGHYDCAIGDSTAWHNGCSGCGRYACSGNYDDYTHNCPECGECYPHVAATPHTTKGACGHTMCSITDPSEHAYCSACRQYICLTSGKEAHAEMSCGHKACQPACSSSPAGSDPLHTQICEHCDRYMCFYRSGGHKLYDCGMHWTCVGGYDSRRHEKLPCGVHSKCEVNESEWALHGACEGCGVYLCGEGVDPAEHDYCYKCKVYYCDEDYAHIEHGYYEDGKCRCTLRHDDYSAQPWSVKEEGVEAHFALDCCGSCDFRKHSGHGQPAECGKEGHIACTFGPHNVCSSCGAKACDEGYYKPDHSLCFACGKRICNGANHNSQASCGHYYCAIGDSTAWHNGCSGCGRYACSGNYDDLTHNCPHCGECYPHVAATPHTTKGACGHTMCSITDPSEHAYCRDCRQYICTTSGKEAHAEMSCGHKACKPADSSSPEGSHPRHTQICEHCDKYMCHNRMGGHNLYECGMHWTCVGAYDSRRHEKLPCGVHYKCEVNESEWALHGACGGGCGTKLCQIDEADRPLHTICTFCELYLCSEDHFVSYAPDCENPLHCGLDTTQHHEVCYGCGLYLCDPRAAGLNHDTAECGHWMCVDYVPAEHAKHEACGNYICDGGNHEPCPECGKCPESEQYYSCPDCGKHATIYCVCDKFYCGDCYYSHQSTCPGFSLPFD